MASKNKVEVRINGKDYTIVGSETEEHIQKVALKVDKTMHKIMEQNSRLSTAMAAVLTAVNIADDYYKSLASEDNLREQVQQYIKETNKLNSELSKGKIENIKLSEKVQQLQIALAKKETELSSFINTFDTNTDKTGK